MRRAWQTARLVAGLFCLLVAVSSLVAAGQWLANYHELSGPQELSWDSTPSSSHVTFPLTRDAVAATYRDRWENDCVIVRLNDPPDVLVGMKRSDHAALQAGERLLVQGMVVQALREDVAPLPGGPAPDFAARSLLKVRHTGEPYQAVYGAVMISATALLFLLLTGLFLRSFSRHRRPAAAAVDSRGAFERWAERYPGVVNLLAKIQLNGFGVDLLDPHEVRPDGSFVATRWLTVAFMPLAPIDRMRIRPLSERTRWVPFLWLTTRYKYQVYDRLGVDRSRNRRVYLFYYLFFMPLVAGPILAVLLWMAISRPGSWAVWLLLGGLVWGMGMVWLEGRLMKRPGA